MIIYEHLICTRYHTKLSYRDDIFSTVKIFPTSHDQLVLNLISEPKSVQIQNHDTWIACAVVKSIKANSHGCQRLWWTQSKDLEFHQDSLLHPCLGVLQMTLRTYPN